MLLSIKNLCLGALLGWLILAAPKAAFANIPNFSGHVYFANQDNSRTSTGIPNVYVKWSDKDGVFRFTLTNSDGVYRFEEIKGAGAEDRLKRLYRTWIKPDQPEVAPIYDPPDSSLDRTSQGYTRMISIDLYGWGLSCSTNPHQFTVIKPKSWLGEFTEASTNWQITTPDALATAKVLSPTTVDNVVFVNAYNYTDNQYVADFYYKPSLIAGRTVDKNNQPIDGVTVLIHRGDNNIDKNVTTDSSGKFSLAEFVPTGVLYSVRINDTPAGYDKDHLKTTTDGWTFRVGPNTNTPLNSPSYELQQKGNNDCSGPAGSQASQTGRCNFTFNPALTPTAALTITTVPPASTPTTVACLSKPFTAADPLIQLSVNGQQLDLATTDTLGTTLTPLPGQSSFDLPIQLLYRSGACRITSLRINYRPPVISSTPTPTPVSCSDSYNRPDSCSCIDNHQCASNFCQLNSCQQKATFQTIGGDVHSNESIDVNH